MAVSSDRKFEILHAVGGLRLADSVLNLYAEFILEVSKRYPEDVALVLSSAVNRSLRNLASHDPSEFAEYGVRCSRPSCKAGCLGVEQGGCCPATHRGTIRPAGHGEDDVG